MFSENGKPGKFLRRGIVRKIMISLNFSGEAARDGYDSTGLRERPKNEGAFIPLSIG